MNSSNTDLQAARAQHVSISEDSLSVDLVDGRTIIVPLGFYPRLLQGTASERNHWRLIGQGDGIHWPDLDEDISVVNLLLGQPSSESQASFKQWQETRTKVAEEIPLA